jgi:predicted Ser/Thr protein kinase
MTGVSPAVLGRHTRFGFEITTSPRPCTVCMRPVPGGELFCPACGADAPTEVALRPDAAARAAASQGEWMELQGELQQALGPAFEVRRLLGRGGFGEVWEAYDLQLGRSVAVKVLRPELATSRAFRQRFHREARAVARMRHSGIVPIYHIGEAQGLMYFIMPLVEGVTLKMALDQAGRLSAEEATRILAEASEALREAHRRGIVHRDLKPENFMLEGPERRVLLMDFGIAQSEDVDRELTGGGLVLGSPEYMSPEQATGSRQLDARSDIYSLGVVGYRMLAGRLPFIADTAREILTQHVMTPPEPLADCAPVPPPLSDAVMRCLAKDPVDRFQSVDELLAALPGDAATRGGRVVVASPPLGLAVAPAPSVPARRPARRRWTLVLGFLVVAAAVAAAGWLATRWNTLRRREAAALAAATSYREATSYQAAALGVVTSYERAADSLRVMADRFRRGALTGVQYRAAELALHREVESSVEARYGSVLNDLAAWPGDLRQHVRTALRGTWDATLPSSVLGLRESATAGCTMERRESVVVLRDGASGTNCWWSAAPAAAVPAYAAPVEYSLSYQVSGSRSADAGLGLAWCGTTGRCRVLWLWLEGRIEWASHATGGGLAALQLGPRLRLAPGPHHLRVRLEGGGLRVWQDGRPVLARSRGEAAATLRQPDALRVIVQNTAIALSGSEAMTVVGMRR